MIHIISRVLSLAGTDKKRIKLGFVLGFIDGLFEAVSLIAIYYLFFSIEKGLTGQHIIYITMMLLVGVVGHIVCRYLVARFQSGTGFLMIAKKRLAIGDLLKRVPLGFFDHNKLGEVTATVTTDLAWVEQYCMFVLDKVVNGFIMTGVVVIFMFFFEPRIGFVIVGGLLAIVVLFIAIERTGKKVSPKRQNAQAELSSAILEYFQGIASIKAFNIVGERARRTVNAINGSEENSFNVDKELVPLVAIYRIILNLASIAMIVVSTILVLNNQLESYVYLTLVVSAFTIYAGVEQALALVPMLRLTEASLNRVEKLTNVKLIDENCKDAALNHFDIEFKNVSFAYDDEKIIHDLSFKVPQNSMTAIVGESGCGKTTLTKLIARFYDVQKGEVLIGGKNIKEMTCDGVLSNISMVFQKVYLFNDTIINNIRLGKRNASEEEIIDVCKKARCHEFIMNLSKGYETMVGEGGANLSGGEKQRISIARAMLKDAPIILLDEATSSVDSENERYIQEAITSLVAGRTLIVIAHRLSTVSEADNILVLNKGQLAQQGKHQDLLAVNGIYKEFWDVRQKSKHWKIGGYNE